MDRKNYLLANSHIFSQFRNSSVSQKKKSEFIMDGPCSGELQNAQSCVASNSFCGACFLPDSNFAEAFPEDVEMQFRTTLAFVPPTDPDFCNEANARVCNYYVEAQVSSSSCRNHQKEKHLDDYPKLILIFASLIMTRCNIELLL
jgi:hypothetical protein